MAAVVARAAVGMPSNPYLGRGASRSPGVYTAFDPAGRRDVVTAKLIAVVDDEEDVRVSTQHLLRSCGARVLLFDCAEAFLAAPEGAYLDGLVTDFRMPGMNGADLLDQLRRRGFSYPVVFISALNSGLTEAMAMERGAAAYLRKPVDPDELIIVLERLHCLDTKR